MHCVVWLCIYLTLLIWTQTVQPSLFKDPLYSHPCWFLVIFHQTNTPVGNFHKCKIYFIVCSYKCLFPKLVALFPHNLTSYSMQHLGPAHFLYIQLTGTLSALSPNAPRSWAFHLPCWAALSFVKLKLFNWSVVTHSLFLTQQLVIL